MNFSKKINNLFAGTVVIPTLISAIYFGLIASDVYVSESLFIVRSPARQVASPLGQILSGTGLVRGQDDAYVVQDYILSRDSLQSLERIDRVMESYSNPNIDIFARFGTLDWDKSFETFYRYFQKRLDLQIDSLSSISTLTVRAYTASDAHLINERLLELAEDRVNMLNQRAQSDTIRFATQEVAKSEQRVKAAALALAAYRNQKGVIDPEKQSVIPLQQVAELQNQLIAAKVQLNQMLTLAKENPRIPSLNAQIALLEKEIEQESQHVAGGGDRSLASKAPEYQRLALEKEFADKLLASAMTTLEQARSEAQRKQLYLERIAQPSKPDSTNEPHRLRGVVATFLLGMIVWGVLSLTMAAVKEHVD
ncbi:hypothetical protein WS75_15285 [Burkholderia sp. FL-7-2-10-S1-D7]|uniref:hypothetical protein n=1 Tax=Burkholderia sp. FL-7-2-10-S1-D7 TaxID=1637866 RepID=UPI0007564E29|nr:hypothetical protein [Burkholderia sp. FL-7-2-10-S1-D7]KVF75396.1 hypothetical protein WS75_15285 [Burkholderia sp. FL-7-2-10-S1-D7]